jgi:nucleotidyltransferase/DNA polymerase involved in DNA repair
MRVTSLLNIGASTEKKLAEVGIYTAEEFLKEDPEDLYNKLEKKHPNLHLTVLASFIGAHSDIPWYFIYHEVKKKKLGNNKHF